MIRRHILSFLLLALLLLCTACGARPEEAREPSPPLEVDVPEEEAALLDTSTDETEDHVLLTLEAPLADGRTLTLEAVGRVLDEYSAGVREVRVYDGDTLIQTVQARDGNMAFWGDGDLLPGESVSDYTSCWKPEGCMEAVDLNFDGNTDLGLFGFTANNIPPYYYWIWDTETEQYRYAFTLQGVEVHPEEGEISSEYKSGSAGSQWIVEYYRPDESGDLYLDRVERDTCEFEPENGYLDYDRGWAHETWVQPEGVEPIRPDAALTLEVDLILIRREIPLSEDNGDGTVSHFTEVWELKDGTLQMTSREEFFYDEQQ